MPISQPYNRLFVADTYYMALYNGTLNFSSLGSAPLVFNLLAMFKNARVGCEVEEDDNSGTSDIGYYPAPYRQRWVAEVEAVNDIISDVGALYKSFFEMAMNVGIGPYWFGFTKGAGAAGHYQRGSIKNFYDILNGDAAQAQTITFTLWGIPEIL
jgi:hypothetical protein